MKLDSLRRASEEVKRTRSRTNKLAVLAACLRDAGEGEVGDVARYLAGETGRVLGIGPAQMFRALDARESAPTEDAQRQPTEDAQRQPTEDAQRKLPWVAASGDEGPDADRLDTPAGAVDGLDVRDVRTALEQVAGTRGANAKRAVLAALLSRATPDEARFLAKLLLAELRQGASEGLVLDALAIAAEMPADEVRAARMHAVDVGEVAEAALVARDLSRFRLEVGRFVSPMLAETAEDVAEAIHRHAAHDRGAPAFEPKLDGVRVQIHRRGERVWVFSRNARDLSDAVPELVERVRALDVTELVVDGEALALDPNGRPLPFQTTMRRFGRRLEVAKLVDELPLTLFLFDLLHDGDDRTEAPDRERRARLEAIAGASMVVERLVTADADEAAAFYARTLARGFEGVMAKSTEAPYRAGRRGAQWLKVKPAHTLDLVVLAVEPGSGRRSAFLSNLHLGARREDGSFAMLGKTFKGMTDEMLAFQTEHLAALETRRERHVVHVRPELVVEVAFDGVQASPHYDSGMALRFARLVRHRPDKRAEEASTLDEVKRLFERARGMTGAEGSEHS